ncbi:hypothetical protein RvY_03756 [Ramazzottius varieornatus]|uniref:Uncharacterized protein n=1 Tax=Ramazzottius varieornatus TaxID=947166 RepID=A0A1D1UZC2_RAMVA|nr:hypothetical protein RvY_03756 [Ramazzottius varieornatus]
MSQYDCRTPKQLTKQLRKKPKNTKDRKEARWRRGKVPRRNQKREYRKVTISDKNVRAKLFTMADALDPKPNSIRVK